MSSAPPSSRIFVFVNMAMTADGKIAAAGDADCSFGSRRDHDHMLELRATADVVMAGARTIDSKPVSLGTGPEKYRRLRLKNNLLAQHLRVVVSGAGTLSPEAEIFRHRGGPIIVLVSGRASPRRRDALARAGAVVKVCGRKEIDFQEAFEWLRGEWKVRRLLCEGGGLLNGALFRAGLVDELNLTICPLLLGGRDAPTICDGLGFDALRDAARLTLVSARPRAGEIFLTYRRDYRTAPVSFFHESTGA